MEKTTITVEVSESSFLGQGKFRGEGILSKLRKAGIPARLADVTRDLYVTDGTLTHNYNIAEGVLTFYWTGNVSSIVEDTPKPRNTGELMNAWRQERYELGQLLKAIEPYMISMTDHYKVVIHLGGGNTVVRSKLRELEVLQIQISAMINNLPK